MHGAGPSNQEDILGRYHRSSSARRELRPPLHQGRRLLAGLHGRYRPLVPMHADRLGPASNRAPRTRGWRQRSEARQSPIRASSVSPAFVHLSSAWKWLLNGESFCPSFVPAITHGWDSQRRELKVWLESLTRRHRVPELSLPGFSFGRVRQVPHRALVNRAARRLGHPASIPRAIMSRSPEALALGPAVISFRRRYHCPSFGCLLNRSSLTGVGTSSSKSGLISASSLCLLNLRGVKLSGDRASLRGRDPRLMMMFVKKWRDHLGSAVTERSARVADRLSPSPFLVLPDSLTAFRPCSVDQCVQVSSGRGALRSFPPEVGAVAPHTVQDDGYLAGHRDQRIFHGTALCDADAPCL